MMQLAKAQTSLLATPIVKYLPVGRHPQPTRMSIHRSHDLERSTWEQ